MSATTQTNNMTMINDMFRSFMERAVNDGPFSEYDDEIYEITASKFWWIFYIKTIISTTHLYYKNEFLKIYNTQK